MFQYFLEIMIHFIAIIVRRNDKLRYITHLMTSKSLTSDTSSIMGSDAEAKRINKEEGPQVDIGR